ncbi:autophagy protein atg9 [Malassezia sp. CBS 17886]|nr:autophagy protein atg9 [Malassezia sp. CBS 17886]
MTDVRAPRSVHDPAYHDMDEAPHISLILERLSTGRSMFQESALDRPSPHARDLPPAHKTPLADPRNDADEAATAHTPLAAPGRRARDAPLSASIAVQLSARDHALWHWANVDDLDEFLRELYGYYVGRGYKCILVGRALSLLTSVFVIGFGTFLSGCIDYSAIRYNGQLSEAVAPHCLSRLSAFSVAALSILCGVCFWQAVLFGMSLRRLAVLRDMYTHLLGVPESDLATVPWLHVVRRVQQLAAAHPNLACCTPQGEPLPLDALHVASRIMRQENFFVALESAGLLGAGLRGAGPPGAGMWGPNSAPLWARALGPQLTRALEWNLRFCLLGYAFDQRGHFRTQLLQRELHEPLTEGLRRRFQFMALANALLAPFLVVYVLLYSFFRYFEELHQNPATLGSRQYTLLARWRFREYNELPHLFGGRCHASYVYAKQYMDQFPQVLRGHFARFLAFVAGSVVAVLLLATVAAPDLFLHYDVLPGHNMLFFLGVFGGVLAFCRGLVPEDHVVVDPAALMARIVEYTHYCPPVWRAQGLHSAYVQREFQALYALKVSVFAHELLSVIFTPYVLWHIQRAHAAQYIAFFRENTVDAPHLGHVCRSAAFAQALPGQVPTKMDQSMAHFYEMEDAWRRGGQERWGAAQEGGAEWALGGGAEAPPGRGRGAGGDARRAGVAQCPAAVGAGRAEAASPPRGERSTDPRHPHALRASGSPGATHAPLAPPSATHAPPGPHALADPLPFTPANSLLHVDQRHTS